VIVARQMTLEGGRLDLLALDLQGRWVIIEIKAGAVYAETIGQALYYAAVISRMPFAILHKKVDEYLRSKGRSLEVLLKERGIDKADSEGPREVSILLVGTGQGFGLDRVVTFLTEDHDFPIAVISFDVYQTGTGERVLVRELTEADTPPPTVTPRKRPVTTFEQLAVAADKHGSGQIVRRIAEIAARYGLHSRNYATSIMYSPQENRTLMLFTVWVRGKRPGTVKIYIGPDAFAQFYPVSEEDVVRLLGSEGWHEMDQQAAEQFMIGLDQLFSGLQKGKP